MLQVDPRKLRLPASRSSGADPFKLQRQIAKFGRSIAGMPNILVYRGEDEELMITDGVTRATRVAKLLPGVLVQVEVIGELAGKLSHLPRVEDRLP
ncbi:MAG: hypothetical protein SFU86_10060 [Pirellulaceae bacterium]|nr:hypothetical protein [Pirellulaceae bacterium]